MSYVYMSVVMVSTPHLAQTSVGLRVGESGGREADLAVAGVEHAVEALQERKAVYQARQPSHPKTSRRIAH